MNFNLLHLQNYENPNEFGLMILNLHYLLSSTWGQHSLKLDKLLEGKESTVRFRFNLSQNMHSYQMIHICIS